MTLRQVSAYHDLVEQDRANDLAAQLATNAMAAQGKSKDINKRIKELSGK